MRRACFRILVIGENNVTILVEHHVLQHRAEAQRLKDIRLALRE